MFRLIFTFILGFFLGEDVGEAEAAEDVEAAEAETAEVKAECLDRHR